MDIEDIPRDRLTVRASRSGGPGGQNVNKVSTRVEVRFVLAEAGWIPAEARARLAALFPGRVTSGGEFRVVSSRFRDQHRNLRDCLKKIAAAVDAASERPPERRPTGPSRGSRHRRMEAKRRRSALKRGRGRGTFESD